MIKLLSSVTVFLILLLFAVAPVIAGEGTDEEEPNDLRLDACPLDELVTYGNLGEKDTDDWFELERDGKYEATFSAHFNDWELEVDFEIYDGDVMVASSTARGSGEDVTCEFTGTGYLHVWLVEGEGNYRIRIEPVGCGDDTGNEPNDDRWTATSVGGYELRGYLCEDDDDWYVLAGQEGDDPTFTMYFDDLECDLEFEIWCGYDLVCFGSGWGSPVSATCHLCTSSTNSTYVHVYSADGEGDYRISISP